MSLMKTLAKVAVGVAVAKGAQSMMRGSQGGASQAGGLGGLLGGLTGGSTQQGGGLQDMLGGLLGGSQGGSGGPTGGLGGLLEQLGGAGGASAGGLGGLQGGLAGGGAQQGGGLGGGAQQGGGLGGLLGGLTAGAGSGGLGGLLGGLAGAAGAGGLAKSMAQRPAESSADFGAVLNSQFDATPQAPIEPSQDQEAAAALMLAAMIQAAKSDGTFDEAEKQKLLGQLGDVNAEEAAFVQAQLQAPVDVDALVSQTPKGLGAQVYAMSVLGIDLDTQAEAQYLHKLATGYGMKPAEVNDIHAQMGIPSLYT
jgi:uncharacterized membrane protein YebE (DUF533 family)